MSITPRIPVAVLALICCGGLLAACGGGGTTFASSGFLSTCQGVSAARCTCIQQFLVARGDGGIDSNSKLTGKLDTDVSDAETKCSSGSSAAPPATTPARPSTPSTPSTPASSASGYSAPGARSQFVNSCAAKSTTSKCQCLFSYYQAHIPYSKFLSDYENFKITGVLPADLQAGITACQNQ